MTVCTATKKALPDISESLAAKLHSRLRDWFNATYPDFTHAQVLCVPAVLDRQSILLTSPTGSGKTLAGFLGVFDYLLRRLDQGGRDGALRRPRTSQCDVPTGVQCIYVSPLRALAYDIEKNLRGPLAAMGLEK